MHNKILLILSLSLLGNYITTGENKKITFKRLDQREIYPDNIVYSYNQGIDFIKTYPTFPDISINQENVTHFLQGPVNDFMSENDLSQMNVNRFVRQNCMVNPIHFSNNVNENYIDGDTALFVTINSKNFVNMNQVIEECNKHNIDIKNIVALDISNNHIEKIGAEELGQFINLQAFVAHNNKIISIDITKNPYLSILACQKNYLSKGLYLMQKIKQSKTPSFVNLIDNAFDDQESQRILHFINVSQEMLKSGAEMVSYLGSKESNQPKVFLPIMVYNKDKKYSLDFFKSAHIQIAEDDNLVELLIHNKAIVRNHIINKKFKVSNFRSFFKKHFHKELNYPQKAIKRFLVISLICNLIKKNHILNFVNNHGNLNISEILNMLEESIINQNNNKNN